MARVTAQTDRKRARQLYEQGITLYQSLDDRWGVATVQSAQGMLRWDWPAYAEARQLLEKGLAVYRSLGEQKDIANSSESHCPSPTRSR
jgi:hypothetical protein